MAKVRVPIWGKPQGHATVNTEATKGAVVGETLYNADGTLYAPPASTPTAGTTKTLWSLLVNLPAIVTSLVNLSTNGWIRKDAAVLTARALAATDSSYDNTTSGLTATDVQGAVDELEAGKVASIVAGTNVTVDATDPKNPIVSASGGGSGGGYAEGATNPVTPALNDKFYRTDHNLLIYYDGTRWLTVNEYAMGVGGASDHLGNSTAAANVQARWPVRSDFGLYLTRWACSVLVVATNSGVNFWTVELKRVDASNVQTAITSSNTSADAPTNWVQHDQAINAPLDATARQLKTVANKTGTPGGLYAVSCLHYRLIVT